MASAFISYSHEDQEFMLALVEQLQVQDLEIRYDQVVLKIGDSLVERISQEIVDGDFLIAIVSPDSVASNWCRRELSLAATQGINQARVKILPIKFRGAEMPPLLSDVFWADADRHAVETIARQLATAMEAHLGGADDVQAAREAENVEEGEGRPAHAEVAGDVVVAQIEEVAQRVWDVFEAWMGIWTRRGNVGDLDAPQRRLRWALDVLPDPAREGLPLVSELADAADGDFFEGQEIGQLEVDVREELLALRRRVAQGLPVGRRWLVVGDHGQVPTDRDASGYAWTLQRGDDRRQVVVYISGTVMASASGLPQDVSAAKNTRGRSVLSTLIGLDDPPREVMVTTAGVRLTMPS